MLISLFSPLCVIQNLHESYLGLQSIQFCACIVRFSNFDNIFLSLYLFSRATMWVGGVFCYGLHGCFKLMSEEEYTMDYRVNGNNGCSVTYLNRAAFIIFFFW